MATRRPTLRASLTALAIKHGWHVEPTRADWPTTTVFQRDYTRVAVAFTPAGHRLKGGIYDHETADARAYRDIVKTVPALRAILTAAPPSPREVLDIELRRARADAAEKLARYRAGERLAADARARLERLENDVSDAAELAADAAEHVRYLENSVILAADAEPEPAQ